MSHLRVSKALFIFNRTTAAPVSAYSLLPEWLNQKFLLQFYWFSTILLILRHTFFSMQEVFVKAALLSPPLFNLYNNDLPCSFENILSDPLILPNGIKLSSLLYADDLIIPSRPKAGLQNCLSTLARYCRSWMLNTNKKTKI